MYERVASSITKKEIVVATTTYEDDDEDSETYGQEIPDVCGIEDIMHDFKNNTKIFSDVIESIQNGDSNNNIDQLTLLP